MCCHLMNGITSLGEWGDGQDPFVSLASWSFSMLLLLSSWLIHVPMTMRLCNSRTPEEHLVCYKILNFLHKIDIQIAYIFLIYQSFWSYRSIQNIQIATDCYVFDRFCFLWVVCLFWWFYGFLWRVFVIEKL